MSRRDLGSTDIAHQSVSVLIAVGLWLTRVLLLTAIPCLVVAMALSARDHVVVAPSLLAHQLATATGGASLPHLIVTMTVAFLGVTLETIALSRVVFVGGEPSAFGRLLTIARRVLLVARRAAASILAPPFPRRSVLAARDVEHGILRQLRRALSISPLAPPRLLTLSSNPLGSFAQSGHRVEVGVAA